MAPSAATIVDVALSGLSPMLAVVMTNPFDVAKTRLQLRGELQRSAGRPIGSFGLLGQLFSAEGVRGCQRGLSAALLREGSKNAMRIGLYRPVSEALHSAFDGRRPEERGIIPLHVRLLAGLICGPIGAFVANPFELLKTRMQAQGSTHGGGDQHSFRGFRAGMRVIVRDEGLRNGALRGVEVSMARSALSAGAGLTTMFFLKDVARDRGYRDGVQLDVGCSLASAAATVSAINPIDVVRTRLYNQPLDAAGRGTLYTKGGFDAAVKIARSESLAAFYKGFVPHSLRVGPHIVITMTILGSLRRYFADPCAAE